MDLSNDVLPNEGSSHVHDFAIPAVSWPSSAVMAMSMLVCRTAARSSATARRSPTSTSGTSRTSTRATRRGGSRRRRSPPSCPKLRAFQGKLATSPQTLAEALTTMSRARQGAVAALRLRQHAGGPGHARLRAAGHAAGDAADLRAVRRRGVVHRARDSEGGQRHRREVHRRRAEAEGLRLLPARHRRAAPRTR